MGDQYSPNRVLVDHVLRYPKTNLKVLVVGAGPGGLLAAIECWRKGHDVQIIEKGQDISSIGDIIALGPSAIAVFRHFPTLLQEYYDVGIDAETAIVQVDGTAAAPPTEFEANRPDVAPHAAFPIRNSVIISRCDITKILYKQCVRLDIPIRWGVYEEDEVLNKGRAVASDGTQYEADFVVAADGLGSRSHSFTLGKPVRAVGTGYSIYRAAI
ncbi:hypothetical protein LQW54_002722 [Pestalotiopsis sp. IQ-011]